MKNQIFSKGYYKLYPLAFLFCVATNVDADISNIKEHNRDIVNAYYSLLSHTQNLSNKEQVSKLKEFINYYPTFYRAYLWLYKKHLYENTLDKAEQYFKQFQNKQEYSQNCNWMLAKIYNKKKMTQLALTAYSKSLMSAEPPVRLLVNFLLFDIRNFNKFKDAEFVTRLKLNNSSLVLANALYSYLSLDWEKAIEQINKLPLYQRNELFVLEGLAYCYDRLGNTKKSLELWHKSLAISRKKNDLEFEIKFLTNIGTRSKSAEKTISYYDSAYVIAKNIGDLKFLEHLGGNLGVFYGDRGEFYKAEQLLQEAIDIAQKIHSLSGKSNWLNHYGKLLIRMDRFDEALTALDSSTVLAKKSKRDQIVIKSMINKGELYRIFRQNHLAEATLYKAKELAENHPSLRRLATIQIAHLLFKTSKINQARAIYKDYLADPPLTQGDFVDYSFCNIILGQTFLNEIDYKKAKYHFQKANDFAIRAKSKLYESLSLRSLAETDLKIGDTQSAIERLKKCLEIAKETVIGETVPAIHSLLGDAYRTTKQFDKATMQYLKTAKIIEKIRKNITSDVSRLGYFGNKSNIYDKLIDHYHLLYEKKYQSTYLDSIYYFMEMKRGRSLSEKYAKREIFASQKSDSTKLKSYNEITKQLRISQRILREKAHLPFTQIDSIIERVEKNRLLYISQNLRLINNQVLETKFSSGNSLADLKSMFKNVDLTTLIYNISNKASYVLVVNDSFTKVIELPITATFIDSAINSLIGPFHNLKNESLSEVPFKSSIAHILYKKVIKPIEAKTNLTKNLLIVPDVHLSNLPLELLLISPQKKDLFYIKDAPVYADHFLLHKYNFSYTPSISSLFRRNPKNSDKNLLVIADPLPDVSLSISKTNQLRSSIGMVFTALPYSRKEANEIKKINPGSTIFLGKEATKKHFFKEAPYHQIIHFATHGFFNIAFDAFSGLVLSKSADSTDDGLLMGYEIAEMGLDCDLVTLSACETGRGKIVPGEGVLGLPRLFFKAGAQSVLMSHWKVDDKFTFLLMQRFYTYYLKQGLNKNEALNKAKREIFSNKQSINSNYQHPIYWASFTLYGNPLNSKEIYVSRYLVFLIIVIFGLAMVFIYKRNIKNER